MASFSAFLCEVRRVFNCELLVSSQFSLFTQGGVYPPALASLRGSLGVA